jgi:hypothetical protein
MGSTGAHRSKKQTHGRERPRSNTIVGWIESVELPRIGGGHVLAKLDTGAETCSLHATHIDITGRKVSFTAGGSRHSLRLKEIRSVKSSNGGEAWRPVIELEVLFNGRRDVVEFTLANRGSMRFPVLLGRNYLQNGFLVDAGFTHLVSKRPRPSRKKR